MTAHPADQPLINEHFLINGPKMWLRANGRNLSLPVLLVLHSGPGFPYSKISELEGEFEVKITNGAFTTLTFPDPENVNAT